MHRTSARVEADSSEEVARVAVDMAVDRIAHRVEGLAEHTDRDAVGVRKPEPVVVPRKWALPSSPSV